MKTLLVKALLKHLAHAAVDISELSNEFVLRTLKRTGFLRWYLRSTLRHMELLIAFMDSVEAAARHWSLGPIFAFRPSQAPEFLKAVDVDEIVRIALESVRDSSSLQGTYLHEAVERGTLIFDTFGQGARWPMPVSDSSNDGGNDDSGGDGVAPSETAA